MGHPTATLYDIADELNSLKMTAGSELQYDMLSDALYWTDEIPSSVLDRPENFWCIQYVLRFRTTLILGKPDENIRSAWDEANSLFPDWPGFSAARCQANPVLSSLYKSFHQRALDAFDAIPD